MSSLPRELKVAIAALVTQQDAAYASRILKDWRGDLGRAALKAANPSAHLLAGQLDAPCSP